MSLPCDVPFSVALPLVTASGAVSLTASTCAMPFPSPASLGLGGVGWSSVGATPTCSRDDMESWVSRLDPKSKPGSNTWEGSNWSENPSDWAGLTVSCDGREGGREGGVGREGGREGGVGEGGVGEVGGRLNIPLPMLISTHLFLLALLLWVHGGEGVGGGVAWGNQCIPNGNTCLLFNVNIQKIGGEPCFCFSSH